MTSLARPPRAADGVVGGPEWVSLRHERRYLAFPGLFLVLAACAGVGQGEAGATDTESPALSMGSSAVETGDVGGSSGAEASDSSEVDPSGGVDTDSPCTDLVWELDHQIWTTGPLPYPLSSVSPSTHFLTELDPIEIGGDDRVILYVDYNLAGFPIENQFEFFLIGLDAGGCSFNLVVDLVGIEALPGPLVDTSSTPALTIPTAPPGGMGTLPTDLGVNAWDITDLVPFDGDCGGAVADILDYSNPEVPYVIVWEYGGFGALVRALRLYRGRPRASCAGT